MRTLAFTAAVACACAWATAAGASGWNTSVTFTNQVVSSPAAGGGYPIPDGSNAPVPGTCRSGLYNSNRSESWVAVQPGTENLVGSSKFFFEKWSTFYDFHLGSYSLAGGAQGPNVQIPGYDCVSNGGTQAMPPDWTNDTDPNVAFDDGGRAYQVTLPFNAYWVNLHPNGAIGVVYSDDLGKTWHAGNGGRYLTQFNNSSALSLGDVVDKQWVAVNRVSTSPNYGSVYAMWAVFNGFTVEVDASVSRDRGQTFSKPVRITLPNTVGPSNTYILPSIDASGDLYVAFTSFPACCTSPATIYVSKIADDGSSLTPVYTTQVGQTETTGSFANTRFRDGITESFAASPTYPGHLYAAWEQWDGTQMDVAFRQSTDGGLTWSPKTIVNDNVDGATPTDQFQPSVAAGSGGAVAVAFYDRRAACPTNDKAILPADQGRQNFCIDVSLQAYADTGSGAVPVGGNVDISKNSWDPEQPGQTVDGISQYPCAAHTDPCPDGSGFIGDYFGLAISDANVYALSVSTHEPSDVRADGGGRVYYQQQVLATVARSQLGN